MKFHLFFLGKINKKMIEELQDDEVENLYQERSLQELYLKPRKKLYPHQQKCLEFCDKRAAVEISSDKPGDFHGGLIAMAMGLGKSLAVLLWCVMNAHKNGGNTLLIVPKSLIEEWKVECIDKFFRNVKYTILHSEYTSFRHPIDECNIVITTPDVCRSIVKANGYASLSIKTMDRKKIVFTREPRMFVECTSPEQQIYNRVWQNLIIDESHYYINPSLDKFANAVLINAKNKWCLTGTCYINSTTDIWAQLYITGYRGILSQAEWKIYGDDVYSSHSLSNAMFKVEYKDTDITIPQKHTHDVYVELSKNDQKIYNYIRDISKKECGKINAKMSSNTDILSIFLNLRFASISTHLLFGKDIIFPPRMEKYISDVSISGTQSKKMEKVLKIISKHSSEKGVVFSMYTKVLDIVEYIIREHVPHIKIFRIDGTVSSITRGQIIQNFKKYKSPAILLMTYKTGGVGLNLTCATYSINMERWWNNSTHNQADARVHRIGQTRPVNVYNIHARNTIEEHVIRVCNAKDDRYKSFFENGEIPIDEKNTMTIGLMTKLIIMD